MFKTTIKNHETKISVTLESTEQPGAELLDTFLSSHAVQNIMRPKDAWADAYLQEMNNLAAPVSDTQDLVTDTVLEDELPPINESMVDAFQRASGPIHAEQEPVIDEDRKSADGIVTTIDGKSMYRTYYKCTLCNHEGYRYNLITNTYCKCHSCDSRLYIKPVHKIEANAEPKPYDNHTPIYFTGGKATLKEVGEISLHQN